MAIINCPSCNKTISSKASTCPHCQLDFENQSPEDIKRKQNFAKYKRLQGLQNQAMMAILLFIIGAYFTFAGNFTSSTLDHILYNGSWALMTGGFIWFAVSRVRIAIAKRQ